MSLPNHISALRQKHRELDRQIEEAVRSPGVDDLEITELKRKKLLIKDEIKRLERQLAEAA